MCVLGGLQAFPWLGFHSGSAATLHLWKTSRAGGVQVPPPVCHHRSSFPLAACFFFLFPKHKLAPSGERSSRLAALAFSLLEATDS